MIPLHEITNALIAHTEGFAKSPKSKKRRSSVTTFELAKIPKPRLSKEERYVDGQKTCIPHPDHRSMSLKLSPRSKLPPPRHEISSKNEVAPEDTSANADADADTLSMESGVVKPLAKCKRIQNALRIQQNSHKRPSTSPTTSRTFLDVMRENELEERSRIDQVKIQIEEQTRTNLILKQKLQEEHEIELSCIRQSRALRDEKEQVLREHDIQKQKDDIEIQHIKDKVQQEISRIRDTQQEARKLLVSNFDEEIQQAENHHDEDALRDIQEYKDTIVKYTEQLEAANRTRMDDMAKAEEQFEEEWKEAQQYRLEEINALEMELKQKKAMVSEVLDTINSIKLEISNNDTSQIKSAIVEKDMELKKIKELEDSLKAQLQQQELEYEEMQSLSDSIQPVIDDAQKDYNTAISKLQDLQKQIHFLNNSIYSIERKVRVTIRSPVLLRRFDANFLADTSNEEVLFDCSSQVSLAIMGNTVSEIIVGDNLQSNIFWDAIKQTLFHIPHSHTVSARFIAAGDQYYHDLFDNSAIIDSIGEGHLNKVEEIELFVVQCQSQVSGKYQYPLVIEINVGKGKVVLVQLSGDLQSQLDYLNGSLEQPSTCVASTLNSLYDNSICTILGDFSSGKSVDVLDSVMQDINRHVSGYNAIL